MLWQLRGYGGNLYFEKTVVTSWDTRNKQVQEVHSGGRSFVTCISEMRDDDEDECNENTQSSCTCAVQHMGECRMVRQGMMFSPQLSVVQ